MVMRSDGAPLILSWKNASGSWLGKITWRRGAACRECRGRFASQRLGGAHKKQEIRTLKKRVKGLHQVELGVDHLISCWLVEFAAAPINFWRSS